MGLCGASADIRLRRVWPGGRRAAAEDAEAARHADIKTPQIYTHYAPDEYEGETVNAGFGPDMARSNLASNVRVTHGYPPTRRMGCRPTGSDENRRLTLRS